MERNVIKFSKQRSQKGKEKITRGLLETIAIEKGVSTKGGLIDLATSSGKTFSCQIGKPKHAPKKPRFTYKDLKRLQNKYKYSDNQIKGIARMARVCAGKKSVE